MFDPRRELKILSSMVAHLTPYLYEDELFGHISNNLPKLTIGGLLLRLHRLEGLAQTLSSGQRQEVQQARDHFDSMRYEWQNHYTQKIVQEIGARINSIKWYLDDCAENMAGCDSGWPNEAEKRTMIAHLEAEAVRLDALPKDLKASIGALDTQMRRFYRPGNFIWDEQLLPVYPREDFWWLYGRPGAE